MVPIKDTILNTGLKARVSLIKATVIIVVQIIHLGNVQHMVKLAIHVTKRGTLSHIADPDREVKARMENGGLIQTNKDSPDVINMKLQQTTGTKVMTPTGSNMNKTLCKCCLVMVYVQTLTLSQTFSLMKLMVKEFKVSLLT